MPFYNSAGKIPKKRHTVFKKSNGGIYYEELVSREGFSYMYSNLYHLRMPTRVQSLGDFIKKDSYDYNKEDHKPYHFKTNNSQQSLLYNKDLVISSFNIKKNDVDNDSLFHRNGDFDALVFIQSGNGKLKTNFGNFYFY